MRISDWSSDVCSSDLGDRIFRAWLVGRASANREYRCRRSAGMDARGARRGCMTDAGFAVRMAAMRAMLISSALAAAFLSVAAAAPTSLLPVQPEAPAPVAVLAPLAEDRKSTRLNSSH